MQRMCQTASKTRTDGRTNCPSVRLSLRWSLKRTDGQTRTATTSPSRRVDVAATRRPCQDKNGRTNERTDGQTPGIEFGAF